VALIPVELNTIGSVVLRESIKPGVEVKRGYTELGNFYYGGSSQHSMLMDCPVFEARYMSTRQQRHWQHLHMLRQNLVLAIPISDNAILYPQARSCHVPPLGTLNNPCLKSLPLPPEPLNPK
jgi:hypothetical protein